MPQDHPVADPASFVLGVVTAVHALVAGDCTGDPATHEPHDVLGLEPEDSPLAGLLYAVAHDGTQTPVVLLAAAEVAALNALFPQEPAAS